MCGHDEDGAGVPRLIEIEPGEALTVFGRVPGQRPTALFRIEWEINDEGIAQARAFELTDFDGEGYSLLNEWMIET